MDGEEHVQALSVKGAGPKPARCASTTQCKDRVPLHPRFLRYILSVSKDHLPPCSKRRLRAQRRTAARSASARPAGRCGQGQGSAPGSSSSPRSRRGSRGARRGSAAGEPRFVTMSFLPFESLCVFLLPQVWLALGIQEIHADQETIGKISAAGQLMWCSASIDILFLLDGSYSIGRGSFERSKHFAGKLCDALDIHPGRVRVGMVQFSSAPHLEFSLDSYLTKQEVKERIKRTVFRGGSTETGRALKYVLRKGFPGGRNLTVPKILIIISDGKSQGSTAMPAMQVKERGTTVFSVGVKFPRWEELHALASEPTEQHVLFAGDASDAANGLYSALSSSVCSVTTPGCKVESFPCERRTLETEKELAGNYVCWKGSKQQNAVHALLCPFYRLKRVSIKHPSRCFRTVCTDPCDSQPCQNGGTCVPEGLDKYHCLCPVGYGGGIRCAPKLSLGCAVDLLFLMDSSAGVTLEGFLRYKAFLKRFLQAMMGRDSPTNVGVAQYDTNVRIPIEVGQHKDVFGLMKSVDALNFSGGGTLMGRALRYIAQHGFRSTPDFADVLDGLPRVVVLLADSKSQDPVAEAAKYARDRDLFLIGVGSSFVRADLAEVTGNPKQTLIYSDPQDLFNRIPELQRRICSVNNPEGVPRGDSPRSPVLPTDSRTQQSPSRLQHFSRAYRHPERT